MSPLPIGGIVEAVGRIADDPLLRCNLQSSNATESLAAGHHKIK
jgi:hypothetical protein